jgi:hypothetical protein
MPLVYGASLGLRAFALNSLLDPEIRPSAFGTVANRFAATAINDSIPILGVGGEPTRLLWFPPGKRAAVVPALILDRLLLVVSDAIFILAVAVTALLKLALPKKLEEDAFIVIAAALLIGGALVWVSACRGLATPFIKVLSYTKIHAFASRLDQAREVDAAIRSYWSRHQRRMAINLVIQMAARLMVAGEVWVGLALLKVNAGILGALIIATVPMATSVLFPFIPNQLGVEEGAQVLVFAALHLNPGTGLSLTILQRLRQLIIVPTGYLLLSRAPRHG